MEDENPWESTKEKLLSMNPTKETIELITTLEPFLELLDIYVTKACRDGMSGIVEQYRKMGITENFYWVTGGNEK